MKGIYQWTCKRKKLSHIGDNEIQEIFQILKTSLVFKGTRSGRYLGPTIYDLVSNGDNSVHHYVNS